MSSPESALLAALQAAAASGGSMMLGAPHAHSSSSLNLSPSTPRMAEPCSPFSLVSPMSSAFPFSFATAPAMAMEPSLLADCGLCGVRPLGKAATSPSMAGFQPMMSALSPMGAKPSSTRTSTPPSAMDSMTAAVHAHTLQLMQAQAQAHAHAQAQAKKDKAMMAMPSVMSATPTTTGTPAGGGGSDLWHSKVGVIQALVFAKQSGYAHVPSWLMEKVKFYGMSVTDLATNGEAFVLMALDKFGSLYIQRGLKEPLLEYEVVAVANQVLSHATELATSKYANYIVQRALESLMSHEKLRMHAEQTAYGILLKNLEVFCFDMYGTRVVQHILDVCSATCTKLLVVEMATRDWKTMRAMVTDEFAHYAVQKALCARWPTVTTLPVTAEDVSRVHECVMVKFALEKFVAFMNEHLVELACHIYACRIVQRVLQLTCYDLPVGGLYAQIHDNWERFCLDPYGHFVVEISFETADQRPQLFSWLTDFACSVICPNVTRLCSNKFGTEVLEKAIKKLPDSLRLKVVEAIFAAKAADGHSPLFYTLLQSKPGFYVLQAILKTGDDGVLSAFKELLSSKMAPESSECPWIKTLHKKVFQTAF